jgi:hypothetical protein
VNTSSKILQDVQNYYGKILKTKNDLQTSACCAADSMPGYLRPYLKNIHEEVQSKFYGCASTFPTSLKGKPWWTSVVVQDAIAIYLPR